MVSQRKSLAKVLITLLLAAIFFSVILLAETTERILYAVRVVRGNLTETGIYYSVTQAPTTFAAWQRQYNFPQRLPGESLQTYRHRVNIAVYYNAVELGLGRELGCSTFQQTGLACFVTNYGQRFENSPAALSDAIAGINPGDTLTHVYAPSSTPPPLSLGTLPPLFFSVQFAAYDSNGNLKTWSSLDFNGSRPLPQICSNCHGGTYDRQDHLVIGGQFTPLNTSILRFSAVPGYTQADQAAAMAALNAMMATIPKGGGGCPTGETLVCAGGICNCTPN